jgi:predicted nucleotidyltransferase component of viral defense system
MRKREIKDLAASVRARLMNVARETKRDFDAILLQYFQERFLYRLSISPYRSAFVLKGALLFLVYDMPVLRPTKDIDFLVRSRSRDMATIKGMVQNIAKIEVSDGVRFFPESVRLESVMEDADYGGIRVKIQGSLDKARKTLQVDIAFGDVLVAGPVEMEFPRMLDDQPALRLKVYPNESAIAEKFQSLVRLNILTSRMKDIYDVLFLASHQSFEMRLLRKAIMKTFNRRETPIEDRRSIFTTEFKSSKEKQTQWAAFLKRSRLESYKTFDEAIHHLELFLEPVCSQGSLPAGQLMMSVTDKEEMMSPYSQWYWSVAKRSSVCRLHWLHEDRALAMNTDFGTVLIFFLDNRQMESNF